jgi:hypothetical protein
MVREISRYSSTLSCHAVLGVRSTTRLGLYG